MFITVGVGFFRLLQRDPGRGRQPARIRQWRHRAGVSHPSCCCMPFPAARRPLTGIEAISNGITAFKEPRSKNAGITLIWMAGILARCFWESPSWPARSQPFLPKTETVISQLARTVYGGQGFLYLAIIAGTPSS